MKKAIGIIGGMGPEASAYLYTLLIELSIKDFGAKNNDDFPEIILFSVPVPDFISDNNNRNKALNMLTTIVKKAQGLDLSCLSIACNTAHILLPQLQKQSQVPFVSMISEVITQVKKSRKKTIGIMGTPSTIRYKLYESVLKKEGITCVLPTDKQIQILDRVIRHVLSGKNGRSDEKNLRIIANSLRKKGAEAIILGCTELPLAFPKKYPLPIFNSLEILAKALLTRYYQGASKMKYTKNEGSGTV